MSVVSNISTKSAENNLIMTKEIEEWKIKQANYLDYKTKMDKESSQYLKDLDMALNQKMELSSNQMQDAISKVLHFYWTLLLFDLFVVVIIIVLLVAFQTLFLSFDSLNFVLNSLAIQTFSIVH